MPAPGAPDRPFPDLSARPAAACDSAAPPFLHGERMTSALTNQVAWVTGGGSGIGLAGAIELARAGCRVVVSGRDAAKLDAAVAVARDKGVARDAISAMPLDVADKAAVARVAAAIQAECGGVDILVNSAGVNFPKRFWGETDGETFDKVVAINLNGATYCKPRRLARPRAGHGRPGGSPRPPPGPPGRR